MVKSPARMLPRTPRVVQGLALTGALSNDSAGRQRGGLPAAGHSTSIWLLARRRAAASGRPLGANDRISTRCRARALGLDT